MPEGYDYKSGGIVQEFKQRGSKNIDSARSANDDWSVNLADGTKVKKIEDGHNKNYTYCAADSSSC